MPCEHCDRRVPIPRADVLGCATCPAILIVDRDQVAADPAQCEWCNP